MIFTVNLIFSICVFASIALVQACDLYSKQGIDCDVYGKATYDQVYAAILAGSPTAAALSDCSTACSGQTVCVALTVGGLVIFLNEAKRYCAVKTTSGTSIATWNCL